jgi:predicted RNase H-like HicB family nuclease
MLIECEEVAGKGWVIHASSNYGSATAQGETYREAWANLVDLLKHYPGVLTGLKAS